MDNTEHSSLVQAKKLLGPYFPIFVAIIFDAWKEWHVMVADNRRLARAGGTRSRASLMSDFMNDLAKEKFADVQGVVVRDGRFTQVIFDGIVALRFKKLTMLGRTQNNPTRSQSEYLMQIALPDFPEAIRLTLGYQLDRLGTKVQDVVLLCENGKDKLWHLSLVTGETIQAFDMFNMPEEDVAARTATRMKPKAKPGDERSAGE